MLKATQSILFSQCMCAVICPWCTVKQTVHYYLSGEVSLHDGIPGCLAGCCCHPRVPLFSDRLVIWVRWGSDEQWRTQVHCPVVKDHTSRDDARRFCRSVTANDIYNIIVQYLTIAFIDVRSTVALHNVKCYVQFSLLTLLTYLLCY